MLASLIVLARDFGTLEALSQSSKAAQLASKACQTVSHTGCWCDQPHASSGPLVHHGQGFGSTSVRMATASCKNDPALSCHLALVPDPKLAQLLMIYTQKHCAETAHAMACHTGRWMT